MNKSNPIKPAPSLFALYFNLFLWISPIKTYSKMVKSSCMKVVHLFETLCHWFAILMEWRMPETCGIIDDAVWATFFAVILPVQCVLPHTMLPWLPWELFDARPWWSWWLPWHPVGSPSSTAEGTRRLAPAQERRPGAGPLSANCSFWGRQN